MSQEVLANLWFGAITLVWSIYIIQEAFITGGSMLNILNVKNSKNYRQINTVTGTHWDGIQVWVILAIGGAFAAFPIAFAFELSTLYIPFFLLLYALIFRGLAIELIYKTDNLKYRKILQYILAIASLLIILVVGVYTTNMFIGLPENDSFFAFITIFNYVAVLSGLYFVCYALVQGFNFIKLNSKFNSDLVENLTKFVRWTSVVMTILLVMVLTGLNNNYNIFSDNLYQTYSLFWALPILSLLFSFLATITMFLKKYVIAFISNILAMICYVFAGYSASFPDIVIFKNAENLAVIDAAAGIKTLQTITIAVLIFLPLVIGYQLFKYIKFWGKI